MKWTFEVDMRWIGGWWNTLEKSWNLIWFRWLNAFTDEGSGPVSRAAHRRHLRQLCALPEDVRRVRAQLRPRHPLAGHVDGQVSPVRRPPRRHPGDSLDSIGLSMLSILDFRRWKILLALASECVPRSMSFFFTERGHSSDLSNCSYVRLLFPFLVRYNWWMDSDVYLVRHGKTWSNRFAGWGRCFRFFRDTHLFLFVKNKIK